MPCHTLLNLINCCTTSTVLQLPLFEGRPKEESFWSQEMNPFVLFGILAILLAVIVIEVIRNYPERMKRREVARAAALNAPPKARQAHGWFFLIQPVLRILSWPALVIGGIGVATELKPILSRGPEYEHMIANPGKVLFVLALAIALFCFGLALRWLATIRRPNGSGRL